MKKTCLFLLIAAIQTPAWASIELDPLVDVDPSYLSSDVTVPWSGNPFRKVAGYAKIQAKEEEFVLGGIVYNSSDPIAIVNDEEVGVGDMIGDRVVDTIGKNYVVLRKGDSLKELVLPPAEDQ
jgi:hypothetical protein